MLHGIDLKESLEFHMVMVKSAGAEKIGFFFPLMPLLCLCFGCLACKSDQVFVCSLC